MSVAQVAEGQFYPVTQHGQPCLAAATASDDTEESVSVMVQHKKVEYTVRIPKRLCREGYSGLQAIMARVRERHPRPTTLAASLMPFNFESAPWTDRNVCVLPNNNYICLAESGKKFMKALHDRNDRERRLHCTVRRVFSKRCSLQLLRYLLKDV